ncbi:hypothetical protein [Haloplanus pelagicus]|uniref:hypothetical protein n=1 Tax=Haloplanus pelagicus TaxID=2949995 RepID=UPI0020416AC2|nr:hypothetical protein [Haloplanus sp. HW8-1]
MDGDGGAVEKARELEANLVQQRVSAMTLFELQHGLHARSSRRRSARRSRTSWPRSRFIPPTPQ